MLRRRPASSWLSKGTFRQALQRQHFEANGKSTYEDIIATSPHGKPSRIAVHVYNGLPTTPKKSKSFTWHLFKYNSMISFPKSIAVRVSAVHMSRVAFTNAHELDRCGQVSNGFVPNQRGCMSAKTNDATYLTACACRCFFDVPWWASRGTMRLKSSALPLEPHTMVVCCFTFDPIGECFTTTTRRER
jgi:hypothetical protein